MRGLAAGLEPHAVRLERVHAEAVVPAAAQIDGGWSPKQYRGLADPVEFEDSLTRNGIILLTNQQEWSTHLNQPSNRVVLSPLLAFQAWVAECGRTAGSGWGTRPAA